MRSISSCCRHGEDARSHAAHRDAAVRNGKLRRDHQAHERGHRVIVAHPPAVDRSDPLLWHDLNSHQLHGRDQPQGLHRPGGEISRCGHFDAGWQARAVACSRRPNTRDPTRRLFRTHSRLRLLGRVGTVYPAAAGRSGRVVGAGDWPAEGCRAWPAGCGNTAEAEIRRMTQAKRTQYEGAVVRQRAQETLLIQQWEANGANSSNKVGGGPIWLRFCLKR